MSYVRFNHTGERAVRSDVYVIDDVIGGLRCYRCALGPEHFTEGRHDDDGPEAAAAILAHLEKHRRAGHAVPEFALAPLRKRAARAAE